MASIKSLLKRLVKLEAWTNKHFKTIPIIHCNRNKENNYSGNCKIKLKNSTKVNKDLIILFFNLLSCFLAFFNLSFAKEQIKNNANFNDEIFRRYL